MGKLWRALEVYRTDGVAGLLPAIKGALADIYHDGQDAYWDVIGGTQSLEVGDTSALFGASTSAGGPMNRSRYRGNFRTLSELLAELRPGDVFYDVGANVGLYTCFAAKHCNRVVAFEPYMPNYDQLQRNVTHNELINVEAKSSALWDEEEQLQFEHPEREVVGFGAGKVTDYGPSETTEVTAVPGDLLIDRGEVPAPTVVKIDVEGAEYQVVEGLRNALSRSDCRLLYCCLHYPNSTGGNSIEDFGRTVEEFKELLREFGFALEEPENGKLRAYK